MSLLDLHKLPWAEMSWVGDPLHAVPADDRRPTGLLVFNDHDDPVERLRPGWALITVDAGGVKTTSPLDDGVGARGAAPVAKAVAERVLARRGLRVAGWSPGLPSDQPRGLTGFRARFLPRASA